MGLSGTTFRHTAIYSAAAVLGQLASFLMLPFYAHIFGAEGYGVIAMIDASLGIFTVLLTGGLVTAILRVYHEQEEPRKVLALGTGIRLVWGIAAGLILLPLVFSTPLSRLLLGSSEYYPHICLALVTFFIDVAGQSASTIQIIRQRSLLFSGISLLRLFIGLGLNIWLVVVLEVGLIGVFISSFASALVGSVAFHALALREHGFPFERQIARELLGFQLPLLPGELITFFGRQAEGVLVRILIGLEGMGVLQMAYKFPPLLNLFISIPFRRAWVTKSFEIAGQDQAPRIMSQMFSRYFFVLAFTGLLLAVTIRSLLELMTPPEFWPAARIAQVEIVTTILLGCSSYMTFGLLYHKRTLTISVIRSAMVPAKIALGFGMIATWGLAGAAYSALLVEVITLLWLGKKSQALYRIPIQYGRLAVIASAGVVLFLLLDGNSYIGFGPADVIREKVLAPLAAFLQDTRLGAWKSGKLVQLLQEKQEAALRAMLNVVLCLAFLLLLPLVTGRMVSFAPKLRR